MRRYFAIATSDHNFKDGEELILIEMNIWKEKGWGKFADKETMEVIQILEPHEYRIEEL